MIYAIIMAVAFIAVVSLITILIVTKKKDEILTWRTSMSQFHPRPTCRKEMPRSRIGEK